MYNVSTSSVTEQNSSCPPVPSSLMNVFEKATQSDHGFAIIPKRRARSRNSELNLQSTCPWSCQALITRLGLI